MRETRVIGTIDRRLAELGIELPPAHMPPDFANYIPFTRTGNLLHIAGEGPIFDGELLYEGKLGRDLSEQAGRAAARIVGLNILTHVKIALDGELDRVRRCIRLFGLINVAPGFTDVAAVLNGASDLMVEVFGAHGRHARVAIGAVGLPLGMAIEIESLFEVA